MTTKISTVLKNTTKNQTFGDLVDWKYDKEYNEVEPLSYCALGVLACNKKLIIPNEKTPMYTAILRAYGVPEDLIKMNYTQELDFYIPERNNRRETPQMQEIPHTADDLASMIVNLNDDTKLSFKEIGEFLAISLGI